MKKKIPQRKPNKDLTGTELLRKAVTGTHLVKSEGQRRKEEIDNILKK